jgi:hypothetical protein
MSRSHSAPRPHQLQGQGQGQLQGQGQGQGQLQGQGQGQAQGQAQYSAQAVDTSVWNDNANWNGNENANGNLNGNGNLNLNGNVNYNENDIENHVTTTVDTTVTVDLSLMADLAHLVPSDNDVIDIDSISGITQSIVMPDVVNQSVMNGNNFNIDQVSNLTDNDTVNDPDVSYSSGGLSSACCRYGENGAGDFSLTATSTGGTATSNVGNITGDDGAFSGIGAASAASSINQEAFTQSIATGANIQFNSIDLQVVGNDISDAL